MFQYVHVHQKISVQYFFVACFYATGGTLFQQKMLMFLSVEGDGKKKWTLPEVKNNPYFDSYCRVCARFQTKLPTFLGNILYAKVSISDSNVDFQFVATFPWSKIYKHIQQIGIQSKPIWDPRSNHCWWLNFFASGSCKSQWNVVGPKENLGISIASTWRIIPVSK